MRLGIFVYFFFFCKTTLTDLLRMIFQVLPHLYPSGFRSEVFFYISCCRDNLGITISDLGILDYKRNKHPDNFQLVYFPLNRSLCFLALTLRFCNVFVRTQILFNIKKRKKSFVNTKYLQCTRNKVNSTNYFE